MLGLPTRAKLRFTYFDASNDRLAAERAEIPEAVRDGWRALGFERIGWTLAVLRLNRTELVHEIWKSADDRCHAQLASHTGRAEVLTLFEDGTIVKTVEKPKTWEWLHERGILSAHREDRMQVEGVRGPLAAIVARHAERVAERARATPVVSASMRSHFATRIRGAELRDARVWLHLVLANVFALAVAIAGVKVTMRLLFGPGHHRSLGPFLLANLIAWIIFLPAQYVGKWFVVPAVVRWRPGPPPRPAAALLAEAAKVRPGRVYRY